MSLLDADGSSRPAPFLPESATRTLPPCIRWCEHLPGPHGGLMTLTLLWTTADIWSRSAEAIDPHWRSQAIPLGVIAYRLDW